ncbi:cytosine permease [Dehalococcoides mccartyi]|uniref:Cytosine permease n=1 Tax=Dehalococcoides mccartyi TaxID=61435 RepID=A0AB38Z851_9CHLR|nr:cytosine permease [Dehalococcoides mccartyi]WRO06722.1 cytosine permease [Dehalococcoides mccartyi]
MSQYPQGYYDGYTPAQYEATQWQGILGTLMGVAVLVAMAAWAFSLVKRALKGEEVKYPL